MHTVDLGIWVHLLTCIASKYERTLKSHRILSAKQINAVWNRLGSRAKELDADDTMFRLNEYKATFMRKLLLDLQSQQNNQKKKGRNPQAWEHHLLMLVQIVYNLCAALVLFVCCDLSDNVLYRDTGTSRIDQRPNQGRSRSNQFQVG
jgi:hypothetical protein